MAKSAWTVGVCVGPGETHPSMRGQILPPGPHGAGVRASRPEIGTPLERNGQIYGYTPMPFRAIPGCVRGSRPGGSRLGPGGAPGILKGVPRGVPEAVLRRPGGFPGFGGGPGSAGGGFQASR